MEPENWAAQASRTWRGWFAYARGLATWSEEVEPPVDSIPVAFQQVQATLDCFEELPRDARPSAILLLWSSTLASKEEGFEAGAELVKELLSSSLAPRSFAHVLAASQTLFLMSRLALCRCDIIDERWCTRKWKGLLSGFILDWGAQVLRLCTDAAGSGQGTAAEAAWPHAIRLAFAQGFLGLGGALLGGGVIGWVEPSKAVGLVSTAQALLAQYRGTGLVEEAELIATYMALVDYLKGCCKEIKCTRIMALLAKDACLLCQCLADCIAVLGALQLGKAWTGRCEQGKATFTLNPPLRSIREAFHYAFDCFYLLSMDAFAESRKLLVLQSKEALEGLCGAHVALAGFLANFAPHMIADEVRTDCQHMSFLAILHMSSWSTLRALAIDFQRGGEQAAVSQLAQAIVGAAANLLGFLFTALPALEGPAAPRKGTLQVAGGCFAALSNSLQFFTEGEASASRLGSSRFSISNAGEMVPWLQLARGNCTLVGAHARTIASFSGPWCTGSPLYSSDPGEALLLKTGVFAHGAFAAAQDCLQALSPREAAALCQELPALVQSLVAGLRGVLSPGRQRQPLPFVSQVGSGFLVVLQQATTAYKASAQRLAGTPSARGLWAAHAVLPAAALLLPSWAGLLSGQEQQGGAGLVCKVAEGVCGVAPQGAALRAGLPTLLAEAYRQLLGGAPAQTTPELANLVLVAIRAASQACASTAELAVAAALGGLLEQFTAWLHAQLLFEQRRGEGWTHAEKIRATLQQCHQELSALTKACTAALDRACGTGFAAAEKAIEGAAAAGLREQLQKGLGARAAAWSLVPETLARRLQALLLRMRHAARAGTQRRLGGCGAGVAGGRGGPSRGGAAAAAVPLAAVERDLALAEIGCCARPQCSRPWGQHAPGRPGRLPACKGCAVVRYCGPSCAQADWERHRPVCQALRGLPRGKRPSGGSGGDG